MNAIGTRCCEKAVLGRASQRSEGCELEPGQQRTQADDSEGTLIGTPLLSLTALHLFKPAPIFSFLIIYYLCVYLISIYHPSITYLSIYVYMYVCTYLPTYHRSICLSIQDPCTYMCECIHAEITRQLRLSFLMLFHVRIISFNHRNWLKDKQTNKQQQKTKQGS